MKGVQDSRSPSPKLLRFMSINVGRGGITHDFALVHASEMQMDVLLIPEPWWSGRAKTYTKFYCYLPIGNEDTRPRAVTYIRKDPKRIYAIQKSSPSITRDYYWVLVNDVDFLNVDLLVELGWKLCCLETLLIDARRHFEN